MRRARRNWTLVDIVNLEGYILDNDPRSIEEIFEEQDWPYQYQPPQSSGGNCGTIDSKKGWLLVTPSPLDAETAEVDPYPGYPHMTYDQLHAMGAVIVSESPGLSDKRISSLPSSKYKIGFFSKKKEHERCAICCMEYKNRDKLTTLPCLHRYHTKCITKWLKMKKTCPVCRQEVPRFDADGRNLVEGVARCCKTLQGIAKVFQGFAKVLEGVAKLLQNS